MCVCVYIYKFLFYSSGALRKEWNKKNKIFLNEGQNGKNGYKKHKRNTY